MPDKLSPYAGTIAVAAAFVVYVFFGVRGSGILLVPLAFVVVVIAAIVLLRSRSDGDQVAAGRRRVKLLILLPAALSRCVAQQRLDGQARAETDAVAKALLAYPARQKGTGCPKQLAEIGIDQGPLRERWYLSYSCQAGKPALFYSAPAGLLVARHYNFEKRAWSSLD